MAATVFGTPSPAAVPSLHTREDASSKPLPPFAPNSIMIPNRKNICQKEHLKSSMSSPNRNGCYDFDRVIKSGELLKRTKKTKSWKPVHLVLRPNMLSIYKDRENTKLRHQVPLYDITAVARQRDPKARVQHVFGLFSPSRNFHLAAQTDREAQNWVESIRREARIDEEDEEMILMSPGASTRIAAPFGLRDPAGTASSSEEPDGTAKVRQGHGHARRRSATLDAHQMHSARRPSSLLQNFSGPETGYYSDFSDPGVLGSVTSLNAPSTNNNSLPRPANDVYNTTRSTNAKRDVPLAGAVDGTSPDDDRVIYQGHLHILKSHHGVRQWRTVWAVLRRKVFAVYKNEEEYSAQLVIAFGNLVDAVEIDPLSKSKTECFQLIAEEKTYRFCAFSEAELDRWLGAFKSLLAKRREGQLKAGAGPAAATATTASSSQLSAQLQHSSSNLGAGAGATGAATKTQQLHPTGVIGPS